MRTFIYLIVFVSLQVFGQFHEIHFGIGGSNYYGDLNPIEASSFPSIFQAPISNTMISLSAGYRYNFQEYFSVGVRLGFQNVCGFDSDNKSNDVYSNTYGRKIRNLSFYSSIWDAFVDVKYEPFRNTENYLNDEWLISPYIGLGAGLMSFDPFTYYNGQKVYLRPLGTEGQGLPNNPALYSTTSIIYPVSLGIKAYSPDRRLSVGVDFCYRYTATDYLDDVSTRYANPTLFINNYGAAEAAKVIALADRTNELIPGYKSAPGDVRGNSKNNDTYFTYQVNVSYYFGNRIHRGAQCYSF
jgi:hypothetical protein